MLSRSAIVGMPRGAPSSTLPGRTPSDCVMNSMTLMIWVSGAWKPVEIDDRAGLQGIPEA